MIRSAIRPLAGTRADPAPLPWVPPWVPKDLHPEVRREIRAWQEKREAQIARLLHRIESGQSQIRIHSSWNDPRPITTPRDPKTQKQYAEDLHKQSMQYFHDLAHTEAGFKLLSDLDASRYTILIHPWEGPRNNTGWSDRDVAKAYERPDGKPSAGASARIDINASLTTFATRGEKEQPWMTERVKYGLYHELVHAWHGIHGTVARGDHKEQPNAEFQAVGLGPWASQPISENTIRQQMGKALRPDVDRVTF